MNFRKNKVHPYVDILPMLTLDDFEKKILTLRYVEILDMLHKRVNSVTISYYFNKVIITIGSLIVPALLSIQYTNTGPGQDAKSFSFQIYWSTWVLSLLVSICNALMSIFKIDKKYIYLHSDIEYLTSEGWQYAQLSGRYSGFFTPGETPTHHNQFKFFCHIIEKIMMKEVEAEFANKLEQSAAHQNSKKASSIETAGPLTPLRQEAIEAMKQFIKEARGDENTLRNLIGDGAATEQQNSGGEDTNVQNSNIPSTTERTERRTSEGSQGSENSQMSVRINMQESTAT